MRETFRTRPWLLAGAVACAVAGSGAQAEDVPLTADLGTYSRAITTSSDRAQQAFDTGLRLAYGFARADAIDWFKRAQAHDPRCAMCAWGEAWVTGPYQNNPAGVGAEADALAAAERARQLADGAAPWERALIDAMALRYRLDDGAAHETGKAAYAAAMGAAAAQFPDNSEVQTLAAEAQMMIRPWNLYRADGSPHPETVAAGELLEGVLARDLDHPGACHLYIHAVEAARPRDAEACADRLAARIPGISHIQHMPSHVYVHLGRYADAVTANQQARAVDQAAERGAGVAIYPDHNTMMLMFAAWLDGQSAVAVQAAQNLAVERAEDVHQEALMLARFGRWQALLDLQDAPAPAFQQAMWRFARGLAQLRTGDSAAAKTARDHITEVRQATDPKATYHFFGHSQTRLLGIAENILGGEILAAEGNAAAAAERLRAAVALEDGLAYSEPEPWPLPARDFLGAALLEAGQAGAAEAVYRAALADHPGNGWALTGLGLSLAAQGKTDAADKTRQAFDHAWQRADVTLAASRF